MKTLETDSISKAYALFSSRVNLPENYSGDYWRNRLEIHLSKETPGNAVALATVEFVSHLIARSLTGSRDKRQSSDGNPDAGGLAVPAGMTWRETMDCLVSQAPRAKHGKRQSLTLSETDKAEISGIVGLVLSSRDAFSRPLNREDIGDCFRLVEGRDGLDLNRRWRPLPDSAPTLAQLALPTYDKERDTERLTRMRAELERMESCIAAMERAEQKAGNRKHASNAREARLMIAAIISRKQSGNGLGKRAERKQRARLAEYLKQGTIALQAERMTSAPWQFDLVRALEAFQAETAIA